MATKIAPAELPLIRAAGGILLRSSPGGDEVMIIFRARHQDWTLPKGKLKFGESFQEAALREVEEETGCRCDLGEHLGTISYAHQGVPKVVMFWRMTVLEEKPRRDGDEITEALWLPVPAAIQCLTYAQEKSLLTRMVPQRSSKSVPVPAEPVAQPEPVFSVPRPSEEQPIVVPIPEVETAPGPMPSRGLEIVPDLVPQPASEFDSEPEPVPVPSTISLEPEPEAKPILPAPVVFPRAPQDLKISPRRQAGQALKNEVDAFSVELEFLAHRGADANDSWVLAAQQHLEKVVQCLEGNDFDGSRAALCAARRYAVLGMNQAELAARAQVLRDEALKMFTWRGPAIQRLLATADDKLTPPRIADAMLLRDEDEAEQLHHLRTSAKRLRLLLILCFLGASALVASLYFRGFGFSLLQDYAPLGFLGLLGSALAAAQQIMRRREDGNIPGPIMLFVLVVAGIVAGLAADSIYQYLSNYLKLKHAYDIAVYPLAFLLGYAVERTLSYFTGYPREHVSVR